MKYAKHGETISVELNNDYSVFAMANWDKEDRDYKLTLYLQDNRIELLKPLQDAIAVPIQAKKNTLYSEIVKYIEGLIENRFFMKHVKSYEFEMKCFDAGIEMLMDHAVPYKESDAE